MLGERRSNSLFAPAAPAEPERKPEQVEVHDISFEERTGRSLFAEATTAPRASELFFAPQEKGVTFAEALSQVQGYLSETYATLITEDNSDAKEQMKRRMARYLQENRIAVDGMTASELVDALYTEMAEYGFLTKYIFADGIEEIDINSWRDIEIQYSDGHTAKLEEHFDSPEHAANVIRRMLQNSGKVLDNASPIITSRLAKNIRISVIKTPVLDEDAGVAASIRNGVEAVWCTLYESVGAKVSGENDKTTGGGLAWGGGCSPSLTPDLVMFTDNADPVKLLALDMKTGKIVASLPVLDDLPEGYQVAVENSAIVYDDSEATVSTIVCNWFGAGSAGLADPNSDSSIQSYANIYDMNWLTKGNCMIAPGVERVDTVKTDSGYEMKSIWSRNDLSDTSILKLSTATGYIYGYVQDLESGMWQYIILDFATGETVFTMDVSNKYGYNNMAIGMYAGNSGNALYCPTGYLELLRLQDRFVYLPEMPYREVDLDKAARNVLTQEQFEQAGGEGTVASWCNTVTVENVHPNTTVSFRMNNLSGSAADLKLYAYGADGKLAEVSKELWTITDEAGTGVDTLADGTLYELRVSVADGGAFDLSEAEKEIKISVVLAK